jgi:hypothetical protein
LIKQYSQFIQFPIKLYSSRKEAKQVIDEAATAKRQEEADKVAKDKEEEPIKVRGGQQRSVGYLASASSCACLGQPAGWLIGWLPFWLARLGSSSAIAAFARRPSSVGLLIAKDKEEEPIKVRRPTAIGWLPASISYTKKGLSHMTKDLIRTRFRRTRRRSLSRCEDA